MKDILKGSVDFEDLHKESLKDPKYKEGYDDLELEFKILNLIIRRQTKQGITYKQCIKELGVKDGSIKKLGTGEFDPSIRVLKEIAKALGAKLTIKLIY